MAVAASHAALLLAQGAGRLLRRADDRGVVAVLDSRMATARYGGYLRASLPPFWTTTDPERGQSRHCSGYAPTSRSELRSVVPGPRGTIVGANFHARRSDASER